MRGALAAQTIELAALRHDYPEYIDPHSGAPTRNHAIQLDRSPGDRPVAEIGAL